MKNLISTSRSQKKALFSEGFWFIIEEGLF